MKIELKPAADLTEAERSGLERLSAEAFPPDGTTTQWSTNDYHVLVKEGDEIVCEVEIVERTATVAGLPVRLGGIGGVSTLNAWRKHGLAEAAMKVAHAYLQDPLKVDFGLLICAETMIHYYARLGWKLAAREMWIDQPEGRVLFKSAIMVLPVCRDEWPSGEINLCGRPW